MRYLPLKDECPVAAAHVVCNLRREGFVVHQEKVDFASIVDDKLFEAVWKHVSCLLVAAITNLTNG